MWSIKKSQQAEYLTMDLWIFQLFDTREVNSRVTDSFYPTLGLWVSTKDIFAQYVNKCANCVKVIHLSDKKSTKFYIRPEQNNAFHPRPLQLFIVKIVKKYNGCSSLWFRRWLITQQFSKI